MPQSLSLSNFSSIAEGFKYCWKEVGRLSGLFKWLLVKGEESAASEESTTRHRLAAWVSC